MFTEYVNTKTAELNDPLIILRNKSKYLFGITPNQRRSANRRPIHTTQTAIVMFKFICRQNMQVLNQNKYLFLRLLQIQTEKYADAYFIISIYAISLE